MPKENLYGLVLAGGRSRRMGRDKSTLVFRGQLQVDRAVLLLRRHCEKVYVSLRDGQDNPTTDKIDTIVDRFGEIGPLGGILSAFYYHRDKNWLVVSCSMPFVDLKLIAHLVENFSSEHLATAYSDTIGEPEALFAIYNNAYKDILLNSAKKGIRDPYAILNANDVHLLQVPQDGMLDSINDNDDYYEAQKRIIGA